MIYEYSDIDFPQSDNINAKSAEADFFTLFDFSAKYDPVPSMLTQNHSRTIKGFMGQTTGFKRDIVKKHILIMGEDVTSPQVMEKAHLLFWEAMTQKIINILLEILKLIFLYTKIRQDTD